VHTVPKVAVGFLVKEQRLLQVARGGDFVGMAIWTRRIALVASFDSLALEIMPRLCAFRVSVKNSPLPHDSFLSLLLFACLYGKLEKFGGPSEFRTGILGASARSGLASTRPTNLTSPHLTSSSLPQTSYCHNFVSPFIS
jgi:hypothetical protein